MKPVAMNGEKRMTLKEVAEATGAAYSTVAKYAQKAGWTQNGKVTLLDERQVTLILEAMKVEVSSGTKSTLLSEIEGTETSISKELRLAQIYKEAALLERELKEEALRENKQLKAENTALRTEVEHADRHANYVIGIHQWHGEQVMKRRTWLPYKDN